MSTTFVVLYNIESLEEIVDQVPAGTTKIVCTNKNLRSLKGIERLPLVTALNVSNNQITSLEGLVGSNVTELVIHHNEIISLKGLAGSKVTKLYINNNQITSLKGLAGSKVIELYIAYNQITSLEGLRGSDVAMLGIPYNRVTSLEGLAGSIMSELYISFNQVASLEGLCGSDVTALSIHNNPCYQQFQDEFKESVEKVKEYYNKKIESTNVNEKMEQKMTLIEEIEFQYNKMRGTKEFISIFYESNLYVIKIGTFTFHGYNCIETMEKLCKILTYKCG